MRADGRQLAAFKWKSPGLNSGHFLNFSNDKKRFKKIKIIKKLASHLL